MYKFGVPLELPTFVISDAFTKVTTLGVGAAVGAGVGVGAPGAIVAVGSGVGVAGFASNLMFVPSIAKSQSSLLAKLILLASLTFCATTKAAAFLSPTE